jgi:hypothetical protein
VTYLHVAAFDALIQLGRQRRLQRAQHELVLTFIKNAIVERERQ